MAATLRRRVEGLDAALADVAKQVRDDLPTILRAFADEALADIRPRWPVASGRSSAALSVVVTGTTIAIVCDVPYASWIHEKGQVGPTWEARIVDYVRANVAVIGARVTRRLKGV